MDVDEKKVLAKEKQYFQNKRNMKRYGSKYPEKVLFNSARYRSIERGIEFNIDLSDIIIPKVCPYLGVTITTQKGNGKKDSSPSIDRIDNSKGYVKGNVQVISELANRMKSSSTIEQLITFSENVIKLHKKD